MGDDRIEVTSEGQAEVHAIIKGLKSLGGSDDAALHPSAMDAIGDRRGTAGRLSGRRQRQKRLARHALAHHRTDHLIDRRTDEGTGT